jgi:hypothetical protein
VKGSGAKNILATISSAEERLVLLEGLFRLDDLVKGPSASCGLRAGAV